MIIPASTRVGQMRGLRAAVLLGSVLIVLGPSWCATAVAGAGPIYPLPKNEWTATEKFVWDCVKIGLEANFERASGLTPQDCSKPRAPADYTVPAVKTADKRAAEKRAAAEKRRTDRFASTCPALPKARVATEQMSANEINSWFLRALLSLQPGLKSEARVISSRFLETIISDARYQSKIGPTGIRIIGAVFLERLFLENAEIKNNLVLDRSIFKEGIDLDGALAAFNVSLDGALICQTLTFKRSNISGELFLRGGTIGGIEGNDASINKGINADNASVLYLFWLDRAKIGRLFSAKEALLSHFLARSAVFDGDVLFDHTRIRCRFALSGSIIGGNIAVVDSSFGAVNRLSGGPFYSWYIPYNKLKSQYKRRRFLIAAKDALKAVNSGPTCRRDILLDRLAVSGSICLSNVLPNQNYQSLSGKTKFIVSMDITTVNNAFAVSWNKKDLSNNKWLFTNTKFGWLYSDLKNWPRDYSLIDTVYQNLSISRKPCEDFLNKRVQNETPNPKDIRNTAAAPGLVLQWLEESHPRSTQPFVNAIAALKSARFDTRDIEIALEDFKLKELTGWRYATQKAYGSLVFYGYKPLFILVWIAGAVCLFWFILFVYEEERVITFNQNGEQRAVRLGFFFSLDNFIPFFKLNDDNYRIKLGSKTARRYLYFHKILGYIFSLFLLAGLTGLTV